MAESPRPRPSAPANSPANPPANPPLHFTTLSPRFGHQKHHAVSTIPPARSEARFVVSCSAGSECGNACCPLCALCHDAAALCQGTKQERHARSICAVQPHARSPRPRPCVGRPDAAPFLALRVYRPRALRFAAQRPRACLEALVLPPPGMQTKWTQTYR
jgi:hypothetical protein